MHVSEGILTVRGGMTSHAAVAVSYTHLDVYKRQVHGSGRQNMPRQSVHNGVNLETH